MPIGIAAADAGNDRTLQNRCLNGSPEPVAQGSWQDYEGRANMDEIAGPRGIHFS
jgi:hypothetical protein